MYSNKIMSHQSRDLQHAWQTDYPWLFLDRSNDSNVVIQHKIIYVTGEPLGRQNVVITEKLHVLLKPENGYC